MPEHGNTEMKNVAQEPAKGILVMAAICMVLACCFLYQPVLTSRFVYTDRALIFSPAPVAGEADSADPYADKPGPGFFSSWTPQRPPVPMRVLLSAGRAWGPRPFGFHALMLLLHVACVMCVLLLWRQVLMRTGAAEGMITAGALAAALLFAGHPVAAAGAAWISNFKNVAAALLCTGSLALYVWDSHRPRQSVTLLYALSVILYAAAVFCDAKVLLWPLVLVVQNRFARPDDANKVERAGRAAKVIPFAALAVLCGVIFGINRGYVWPGAAAVFTQLAHGVRMLVAPVGPAISAAPQSGAWSPAATAGAAVLVLLAAAVAGLFVRRRAYAFCLGGTWLLAALVPHVFETREFMTDTGSYFAAAAVCGMVAAGLHGVAASPRARVAAAATVLVLAVVLGFGARANINVFKNNATFWSQTATAYPHQAGAWYFLGLAQLERDTLPEAGRAMKKALALEPHNILFRLGMGHVHLRAGRRKLAEAAFDAVRKSPALSTDDIPLLLDSYYQLGKEYFKKKKYDDAERAFRSMLSVEPTYVYAHTALAEIFLRQKRYQEAYTAMAIAVALQPDMPELRKSRDYVLKQAQKNGVFLVTKGVTKPFFDMLEKRSAGK